MHQQWKKRCELLSVKHSISFCTAVSVQTRSIVTQSFSCVGVPYGSILGRKSLAFGFLFKEEEDDGAYLLSSRTNIRT